MNKLLITLLLGYSFVLPGHAETSTELFVTLNSGNPQTQGMALVLARLFRSRKQVERAAQMRNNAAPVDVGDQDHRAVDDFGKAHVGDVALAQIDLGRAAGAFDDYALVGSAQALLRLKHGAACTRGKHRRRDRSAPCRG